MSKTFSKKELKVKAEGFLKKNPHVKEVFATVDGQIFLAKNRAQLHSKDKIYAFYTQPKVDYNVDLLTKAKDIIAFIEEATSLDAIQPYEKDVRATVKEAYTKKVEELKPQE